MMEPTVLIIGAGTFGTSTAYHLAQNYRDASRVTIIDREASPPTKAAAIDINRIIRADYPSTLYCNLANEAIHTWFWSNELGPCFHKVGWLRLNEQGSDMQDRIFSTLRGRGTHIMQDVPLDDLGRRWDGFLAGTETNGFGSAYFNPDAGWVDAASATTRFMATATGKGVKRVVGDVVELLANTRTGRVEGCRTADGRRFLADKVVLAVGGWTSAMLAPVEDKLGVSEQDSVERQAQATAIVSAYYRVSDVDAQRMADAELPCVIYGQVGEVIPASKNNKLLKYNNSGTRLVNTVRNKSGRKISTPADRNQSDVPEGLKRETEAILTSKLMPRFAQEKPEYWRICWDSMTPSEDLLLCEHAKIKGIYVMAGGSFCGYKYVHRLHESPCGMVGASTDIWPGFFQILASICLMS
jgi:sarcosine oxidase / L-pipecolate oxidase